MVARRAASGHAVDKRPKITASADRYRTKSCPGRRQFHAQRRHADQDATYAFQGGSAGSNPVGDTRKGPSDELNGQPVAILRDRHDQVVSTLTLEMLGGRIQAIRSVVDPDKLRHLGPVADAWALHPEFKPARQLGADRA